MCEHEYMCEPECICVSIYVYLLVLKIPVFYQIHLKNNSKSLNDETNNKINKSNN